MADKKFIYDIEFRAKSESLEKVKKDLREISNMKLSDVWNLDKAAVNANVRTDTMKKNMRATFEEITGAAKNVEKALVESFNPKLNTINLKDFESKVKSLTGSTFSNLNATFEKAGAKGKNAFRDITTEILTAQKVTKKTSKIMDKLATSLANTISWSISSSLLNAFTSTLKNAWNYAVHLDASLNDIRIVTGKSADEMDRFAKQANKMAKELKSSTIAYSKASLIYYQQGLGDQDVKARTDVTVKAANVTGQSAAEVSEQLTAVWNGYRVVAEEAELYVDKLAAVAASTAADLEELSTGMSKVASAANAMGIDIDQLTAQLATIVSVTRQDASSVGTALKTIFARMGDLKVDGVDEFGVSLGDVSGTLEKVGIHVLDAQGNLRDMGTVIEEVAEKWGIWTEAQQQAIAIAMAGKRQYNNLLALFENWDMYESSLSTSKNAEGTLQEQQDIYTESSKAHIQDLQNAWDGLFDSLMENDSMNKLVDVFAGLIKIVDSFVDGIGGGGVLIGALLGNMARLMSGNIAKATGRIVDNFRLGAEQKRVEVELQAWMNEQLEKGNKVTEKQIELKKAQLKYGKLLTEEEMRRMDTLIKENGEIDKKSNTYREKVKNIQEYAGKAIVYEETERTKNGSDIYYKDFVEKEIDEARNITSTASKAGLGKNIDSKINKETEKNNVKVLDLLKKQREEREKLIKLLLKEKNLTVEQRDNLEVIAESTELNIEDEQELLRITEEVTKAKREQANFVENAPKEAKNINDEIAAVNKANNLEKAELKTKIIADGFSQITGSVLTSLAALQSFANMMDVLNDEASTSEEKTKAIVSTAIMLISTLFPMILSGIKMIRTAGKGAGHAIQKAFGWISIILAIITVALTAIVAILKSIDKETDLEKANKELKKAEETAKKAKESFDDAKKAYSNLISEMEKYKNAKKGLEELREGTEEWQKAVEELNLQVFDLLTKYPLLAQYVTTLSNGVLEISQDGWDLLIKNQRELINESYKDTLISSNAALVNKNATLKLNRENLLDKDFDKRGSNDDNPIWQYNKEVNRASFYGGIPQDLSELLKEYNLFDNDKTLDLNNFNEKVLNLTDEDRNAFLLSLNKLDIGEEQEDFKTALIDLTKDISATAKEISKNNNLLERNYQLYLRKFAPEGVREDVFAEGAYNIAVANGATNESFEADKLEFDTNIGFDESVLYTSGSYNEDTEISSDKEKGYMAEKINEMFKEGYGINNVVTSDDIPSLSAGEIYTHTFFEFTDPETGTKIAATPQMAANKAQNKKNEAAIEQYTENFVNSQKDAKNKGVSEAAAYFGTEYANTLGDKWSVKWNNATFSEIDAIEKANVTGVNNNLVRDYKKDFVDEFIGENSVYGDLFKQDGNLGKQFYNFTRDDFKNYSNNKNTMTAIGAGDLFTDLFAEKDADATKEINDMLTNTNFADSSSVAGLMANLIEKGYLEPGDTQFEAWEGFFNTINKGNAQWIKDSKKVIDNLTALKNITDNIKIGDIISDEEYKQLLAINPLLANDFMKTAGGYVAINSGDEIRAKGKKPYENLDDIQSDYAIIRNFANGKTGETDLKIETTDDVTNYFNSLGTLSPEFLAALGIDPDLITQAQNGDVKLGKTLATTINQAILDANNGLLDNDDAAEYFITSVADSWSDVENSRLDKNSTVYKKGMEYWRGQYASELGLFSTKSLSGLDMEELEQHVKKVRALQLNMYEETELKINKLGQAVEKAFGQEKINQLEELAKVNSEEIDIAKKRAIMAKNIADGYDLTKYGLGKDATIDDIILAQMQVNSDSETYKELEIIKQAKIQAETFAQEYAEKVSSLLDTRINIVDSIVEITLDLEESKRQWEEFRVKYIERSGVSIFEDLSGSDNADLAGFNFDSYQREFNKFAGMLADFGDPIANSSSSMEEYKKLVENAKSSFEGMFGAAESMMEAFSSIQEEIMALYDKQIEKLANINSLYQGSIDLLKLTGNKIDGYSDKIKNYFGAITENATMSNQLSLEKLQAAQRAYNENYERASKEQQEMLESNLNTAANEVLESSTALIEAVTTQFQESFVLAIDEAFGDGGLSKFSEEWQRGLYTDERYLDEVNKEYSLSEFERKIQNSIDSTDSYSAQKKLNKLKEQELEILRKKDKLTKDDLDRANARYELELKRIALEEAQQTASKMKLARDASGNYTYQYVQDKDAIAKAEAELAKAENDLYNLSKGQEKELVGEITSKYQEAVDAIGGATIEEEKNILYDYYFGSNGVISLLEKDLAAIGGEGALTGTYSSQYQDVVNKLMSISDTSIEDSFNTALADFGESMGSIETTLDNAFGSNGILIDTFNTLQGSIEEINPVEVENLLTKSNDIMENIKKITETIQNNAETLYKSAENYMNSTVLGDNTKAIENLTSAILADIDSRQEGNIDGKVVIEKGGITIDYDIPAGDN